MLKTARSYEEACRTFRWRIPERYNVAFDVCDRQTMAGADGHRTALIVEAADLSVERYTFHVLRLLSNRLANVLRRHGVVAGDRVALALPAGVEAAVGLLAVLKMGALAVPVPVTLGAEPLAWRLADAGARAVVVDDTTAPALAMVRDQLPHLAVVLSAGEGGLGAEDLWAAMEGASDSFSPEVTGADDPAFVFYPADACGRPRGVVHAHRAMLGNLPAVELALDFFPQFGDVMWTAADWMTAEALFRAVLPAWHHGVAVVARAGGFDPVVALEVMARHGVRAAYLPADALAALTDLAATRPHPMPRALLSGPDPLDEGLHERVRKVFSIPANEAWGVLESGAVVAGHAGLMEWHPGSPGRAVPGLSVEAVDERGKVLRAGERGILAVSPDAPGSFLGYWGDEAGSGAGRANGWLLTGRLGSRDLDGYLSPQPLAVAEGVVLVDGFPVRLEQLEAALARHPDVAEAAVVALPTPRGVELMAFVVPAGRAGDAAFLRELQAWAAARRAAHEVPRRVEFVDDLPVSADGKVKREELLTRPLRVEAPSLDERWSPSGR
jgi:acetyl-CoA synthetase